MMITIACVLVSYWLVRVTLVAAMGFAPKCLEVENLCIIALLEKVSSLSCSDNMR